MVKVFFCESSLLYKKSFSLTMTFCDLSNLVLSRMCLFAKLQVFRESCQNLVGRILSQISKKLQIGRRAVTPSFGMVYRPGSRALRNCSIGARRRYSHFAYFAHLRICTFCQFYKLVCAPLLFFMSRVTCYTCTHTHVSHSMYMLLYGHTHRIPLLVSPHMP